MMQKKVVKASVKATEAKVAETVKEVAKAAEKKAEAGRTAVRRILQSQPDHWHGTSIFLQK